MYKKIFENYVPICEQEVQDKRAILQFIKLNNDCLLRSNLIAHITSSAIVVNKKMDKVLFIHHNIYNSWGWVGGHNDGNPNLLEVAIKEAIEETGVTHITPYNNEVLGIDVIYVENHIKNGKFIGDHLHLNATFLLIADENEKLIIKEDENSGVKWFYINDVVNHVTEERIKTVYIKLLSRIKSF
ncbi:MAG: NUDIX hydrolase [Firmicutes bacterium]|nr:NUDIX hydrolase [Bacillota bacterium]